MSKLFSDSMLEERFVKSFEGIARGLLDQKHARTGSALLVKEGMTELATAITQQTELIGKYAELIRTEYEKVEDERRRSKNRRTR